MDAPLEQQQQIQVAGIRFNKIGKLYHFDYSAFPDLGVSDHVIVETARGRRMGQVMAFALVNVGEREHKPILRKATPRDLVLSQHWTAKAPEALEYCTQRARKIGGFDRAKFIEAQYNYDGSVLTILYHAEEKPETNRLLAELTREFDAAIELRQIGPRDVAKLLGGGGACGKADRCCSSFLTDFSPISIKMAKVQGISLNPSEITGMCGRLRCCLVYEYEQYVEARKQLPRRNKVVGTPFGEGRVVDVHPLQDMVTVLIPEEGYRKVERKDIVPLEEMKALADKAGKPCDKHNPDEPCDCGAKPGNAATANKDAAEDDLDE
ncbi:MAG: PSP1 domain-containing protein [Phototrophicaceae bacterium]|jgi:cell fate regulator YaaT (PSP1 superfamily)